MAGIIQMFSLILVKEQAGDMKFTKGNLALRGHLENAKRVFLFESVSKDYVRFTCEVEVFDADYFETHDTTGSTRIGIRFFFKKIGVYVPLQPDLFSRDTIISEPIVKYSTTPPNCTERKGLVTSRVGQGAYRKSIIHRWEYKCAVTGFDELDIQIASHIVPWTDSNDNERLDVDNGILLSPTYDALFDRHLISFENNGKIILSDALDNSAYKKIGVSGREKINNLSLYNRNYLERHRISFNNLF